MQADTGSIALAALAGAVAAGFLTLWGVRLVRMHVDARLAQAARDTLVDAIDTLPEAFAYFGADGRLVLANQSFRALHHRLGRVLRTNLSYETFTQTLVAHGLVRLDRPAGDWIADRLVASKVPGAPYEIEMTDGRVILVDERRTPGGGLVSLRTDVTGLKEAEAERDALREQFLNAQKMEAVGRLAGGIAHDFNNILAAVNGYAHMLAEDLAKGSEQHGFATQILAAGERARNLVGEILAFSRAHRPELSAVRLNAVVEETLSLLWATLPAAIALQSDLDEGAPDVHGNATQIAQVLMNLCVNARDAIAERPGFGPHCIRVETARVEIDGGRASGLVFAPGSAPGQPPRRIETGEDGRTRMWVGRLGAGPHVRLRVRDTGPGIGAATMERIFDPFFTTKDVGRGTGLGLAAVHGIVAGHDGAIAVETRAGHGTVFDIFLPVRPAPVAVDAARSDPPARASRGGASILVVDDEEMVATMIAHSLERLGHEVACTTHPDDALEAFVEDAGAFDLVVTDQSMPGLSGLDLSRRLLAARPDLPIVLCSGYAEAGTERAAREAGIAAFMTKPLDLAILSREVDRLLARKAA